MNYQFFGKNHPEANGRHPVAGEEVFALYFCTDEGGTVTVLLGRSDYVNIAAIICKQLDDDEVLSGQVADVMDEIERREI